VYANALRLELTFFGEGQALLDLFGCLDRETPANGGQAKGRILLEVGPRLSQLNVLVGDHVSSVCVYLNGWF
jgi:hypothetical protein